MESKNSEILLKLESFFSSPNFTSAISNFFGEESSKIEFVDPEGEQPFSNFDEFKKYTDLIEQQLESFIVSEHLTSKEVVEACIAAKGSNNASQFTCVDYLIASTEYETFMQLAYDYSTISNYVPDESTEWIIPNDADDEDPIPIDNEEDEEDVVPE
mmetsp:Transcript_28499/g.52454  ORF Transcript_28499/g.52454 Transcript_28499/m.52454 type:complete len:157 (+) Transcript_28499:46-516(+)